MKEKLTKAEALQKIQELKKYIGQEEMGDWVRIDYTIIPKDVFDRYGCKPFEIMRKKMRKSDGGVWNNISFCDAKKECEKLGYYLPTIQQHLVLLDWYKHEKGKKVSIYDKEIFGIEEVSYDESVYLEWVDGPAGFIRGGLWYYGGSAGVETLYLHNTPGHAHISIGFRCAR